MPNKNEIQSIVKNLGDCTEEPHFRKTSFRSNKKIFATYDENCDLLVVKLSTIDQDVFCLVNKGIISPVPNKWGAQGWTQINLSNISQEVLIDVLSTAYKEVSKK